MRVKDKLIPICLMSLVAVALTGCLYWMRPILVPSAFSLFLFFMVSPFIDWMDRNLRIPKFITMSLTIVLFVVGLIFLVIFVGVSLRQFIQGSGIYQQNLLTLLDNSAQFFLSAMATQLM